jgi:hypothetical protein
VPYGGGVRTSRLCSHSGLMDVLGLVINVVLVMLTLVVIWYARRAVMESRHATEAARDTITAIGSLLEIARDQAFSAAEAARATSETVNVMEDVVRAARETVDLAALAHQADGRDREIRRLRDIGELVERIFEKAAAAAGATRQAWRCIEQRELPPLLVGTAPPMPKCDHLAGESQAESVMTAAVAARDEITARLRELHAAGHP